MSRILVHAPTLTRWRPVRARRVAAPDVNVEYSPDRQPQRLLIVGAGILGAFTAMLFVAGLVAIA